VLRVVFLSAGAQLLTSGADGLLKLWHVRGSECINTFEAADDKVWALTTGGPAQQMVASGGGDGSVCIWEDATEADAAEQAEQRAQQVLAEQELFNALHRQVRPCQCTPRGLLEF
jgi:U3 small nucleolar RNA-associated protein 13